MGEVPEGRLRPHEFQLWQELPWIPGLVHATGPDEIAAMNLELASLSPAFHVDLIHKQAGKSLNHLFDDVAVGSYALAS